VLSSSASQASLPAIVQHNRNRAPAPFSKAFRTVVLSKTWPTSMKSEWVLSLVAELHCAQRQSSVQQLAGSEHNEQLYGLVPALDNQDRFVAHLEIFKALAQACTIEDLELIQSDNQVPHHYTR
jgi:hypothetical protein